VKVVLSWLRELCPTERSAEDLAELLTRKGAEVEAIEYPWERVSGVVVARVLEVPVLGAAVRWAEHRLADLPGARDVGGFLVACCQRR